MLERTCRHSFAATALLAVWGVVSHGASAALGQQAPLNPGLTPLLRYFELRVVSGRIVATSPHRDRRLESQSSGKDRRERLSATLSGDATTVSYEQTTTDWQLSFEVIDGAEVVLRRQSKEKDALKPLVFHQPQSGPISLRIGEGPEEQVYEAGNLWRLLVAEPEICREQLIPLVELLKPDWKLNQTALAAEQALYDSVRIMESGNLESWQALVRQLGDSKFSRRQAADRELRAQGRGAALFLMSIDWRPLDAEQQSRVRAMFDDRPSGGQPALTGGAHADAPERIALWLVRDPRVWLKLLERDDEDQRRLAVAQLQRLLSAPLAFDPAAAPSVRDVQLAALRRELLDSGALTRKTPRR
jgi:hypothetical protein